MKRLTTALAIGLVHVTAQSVWAAEAEHGGGSNPFAGDLGTALWTLIIFVLLLVVLGKFVWPRILQGLQQREQFIHDCLQQAKRDRESAKAQLEEYTEKVHKAREEATAIVEEGRRDAEAVARKIHADAAVEAQKMLERARKEITLAKDTAVRSLYELTAEMAADLAGRIIRKELTPVDRERLIAESIKEIKELGLGKEMEVTAHGKG